MLRSMGHWRGSGMWGDFRNVRLSEVAKVQSGFAFKSKDMGKAGAPIVKIKNIVPPLVDIFECQRVPYESIKGNRRIEHFSLGQGDILIAMTGATVGKVGRMPEVDEVHYLNQRVGKVFLTSMDKADYDFIYYALSQDSHARHMFGVADGSAQANISGSQIERLKIPLPDISEQKRIAAVLGALDDKIELNRKMNKTLEEMAQAIFKSWFVDFEPFRDGCMVDSDLGPIPKGWKVMWVGDAVKVVGGSTPSTKKPEFWDGGDICWTTPKDLSSSTSTVLLDTKRKITKEGLAKISSGTLPAGTFLLSSRAPVGYTAIACVPIAVNQGYIAIPPGGRLSSYYLLHWARHNLDRIKARSGGTTFQEISKRNFRPMLIVVPTSDVMSQFDSLFAPLFDRIENSGRQSQTLAELRDTLLPKLISGEICIADIGHDANEECI